LTLVHISEIVSCNDCSLLVGLLRILKTKKEKIRDVATSPLSPPYTFKTACLNFGKWSRVLDVINHAKFQLDRFRGFGPQGGRKSLSPIDWRYRPYNVLHCDDNDRV